MLCSSSTALTNSNGFFIVLLCYLLMNKGSMSTGMNELYITKDMNILDNERASACDHQMIYGLVSFSEQTNF